MASLKLPRHSLCMCVRVVDMGIPWLRAMRIGAADQGSNAVLSEL
jgi:hypothetical protein